MSTGRAGQILRLLSFDALLRKLRFDFSDTFSEGFYYDSIRSTAWIKDGVMHTDDTLVDGLEADIAMKGFRLIVLLLVRCRLWRYKDRIY